MKTVFTLLSGACVVALLTGCSQGATNDAGAASAPASGNVNWEKPLYTVNSDGDTIDIWTYDKAGNCVKHISSKYYYSEVVNEYDAQNRLVKSTDSESATEYIYSPDGKLTEERLFIAGNDEGQYDETVYTYNDKGQIATRHDVTGLYTYTYDSEGRLSTVDDDGEVYLQYEYLGEGDKAHREISQFFNALYDDMGRCVYYSEEGGGDEVKYEYADNVRTANITSIAVDTEEVRTMVEKTYYAVE